jgi:hypothetical protein
MKFTNFYKNKSRMTTEKKQNEEFVDQTAMESNEINTDTLAVSYTHLRAHET